MYKKSSKVSKQAKVLFLALLLIPSYGSALWEIPTAVAVGWWLRTPMGQKVSMMMFASCKQKMVSNKIVNNYVVSSFNSAKDARSQKALQFYSIKQVKYLSGFMVKSFQRLKGVKPLDQKLEDQGSLSKPADTPEIQKAGFGSVLASLQPASMKSFLGSLDDSTYSKDSDRQGYSYSQDDTTQGCNFTKVDASVSNQSASGMFPRITNNYYSGSSGDTSSEFGKKRFFQGAFAGSLVTSWIYGKQSQKAKN
jgi:hypothetical protein